MSSLVGGSNQQMRTMTHTLRVRGLHSGWSCEFAIRPGCDTTLFDKYCGLPEFIRVSERIKPFDCGLFMIFI